MFQRLRISGAAKTRQEARAPSDDKEDESEQPTAAGSETDPSTTNSDAATTISSGVSVVHSPADDGSSLTASASSPTPPSFTLLEELADALIGAVAVYGMADVRSLLRAGHDNSSNPSASTSLTKLSGDPELLRKAVELPISRSEMMQLLQLNLEALHQNKIPADLYLSLLDSFGALNSSGSSSSASNGTQLLSSSSNEEASSAAADSSNAKWLHSIFKNIPVPARLSSSVQQSTGGSPTSTPPPPSVYVAVFDDENSSKELVYYIAVDEERKLIKVVFRGSVTIGDWMADVDSRMATVPNPLNNSEGLPERKEDTKNPTTVSIHQGFYSYMFGTTKANPRSKYDTIVGHVQRLLAGRSGYRVRVSGHSLGGALSTVFAFHAAADPQLPKPVVCVSFASPRVGNLDFARSYQRLERAGRLRSIRVVNDKDVVTQVPDRLAYAVALTNSIYRHVGIELKLFRRKQQHHHHPRIHFPTCHASTAQHLADDASQAAWNWFTRPVNLVQSWRHDYAVNHSCKEYSDRLADAAEYLQSRTVDDLVNEYMAHCRA